MSDEIKAVAELKAALGHMLNAAIDLDTGAPKRTALATLNGGIKRAQAAIAALDKARGDGWQPIETAPRDSIVLLYGFLRPHPESEQLYGGLDKPTRVTGYWDEIDESWCPMGATFLGPWFDPTNWHPLPAPPSDPFAEWIKPFEGEG
jgi:hypothetical protein